MAKLTAKAVERELRKLRGNMSAVARVFGVSRQAIQHRVNISPTLKQAVIDAREERLDNAESSLDRAIINGEAWAVCFSLKCQGKDRGYIERHEHAHGGSDDMPSIEVVVLTEDERQRRADELLRSVEARRLSPIGTGTMGYLGGHANGAASGNGTTNGNS